MPDLSDPVYETDSNPFPKDVGGGIKQDTALTLSIHGLCPAE